MSGSSLMPSRITRPIIKVGKQTFSLYLTQWIARAQAADLTHNNCSSLNDKYVGNSHRFSITSWVHRGICVRSDNVDQDCYDALTHALQNLDLIRAGEYTGAASLLALLPTIGAILGAPPSEIWRLLPVVPFGGGLAMTLLFGAAILPVRVEDYQDDSNRRSVAFRGNGSRQSEDAQQEGSTVSDRLVERILARMRQAKSRELPKGHIWVGLLLMILLFVGAQAAMIVIEQGGVIPWWCVSRGWMHLWYFLVTFTAIAENWAQFPFQETWKLFVSDIPYNFNIRNGDSIPPKLENSNAKTKQVLHRLASLKAGEVTLLGSKQNTRPRNRVLVMLSLPIQGHQGQDCYRALLRLISKCASITLFITGTALFASVQLLALPVAVLALTLILAAGIFSRAIAGWIVSEVSKTEPLIHEIVETSKEAQELIFRVLSLDEYPSRETGCNETRKIQVEFEGLVFVGQRRVDGRSPWYLRTLGVLAEPFDLKKVDRSETSSHGVQASTDVGEIELGLMQTNG